MVTSTSADVRHQTEDIRIGVLSALAAYRKIAWKATHHISDSADSGPVKGPQNPASYPPLLDSSSPLP